MIVKIYEKEMFLDHPKLLSKVAKVDVLIDDLNQRIMPARIKRKINDEIRDFNEFVGNNEQHSKLLDTTYRRILKIAERELGLVRKGHYQVLGLGIGVPWGLILGLITTIPLLIGPLSGVIAGLSVGYIMDARVNKLGKQLKLD